MPEVSLKNLSDAAPPGPWALSPQELDDWGMIRAALEPETGFRPVVCSIRSHDDEAEQAAARQEGRQPKSVQARADFIIALERAYRAGRLHDDTALATAVARARREALEEAARIVESQIDQPDPYSSNAELARADTLNAGLRALASDIRALAATPPEARQTETGWKPISEAPKDGRMIGVYGGCAYWHPPKQAWVSGVGGDSYGREIQWPLTVWMDLSPPPAIGNLEGEGRSHEA